MSLDRRSVAAPGPARAALAVLGLLVALPGLGLAAGAWQTHIRTRDYTDVLVTGREVWCATDGAGLLRFDRLTKTFSSVTREPGSIASNQLTSLAIDRIGRLWVGTFASGVSRLSADGTTWELVNAFDGLPVDSVTTITVEGDTLWIGTRGGIALWDGRVVLGSLPDGNTVSFDTTFSRPEITGVEQLGDTVWLSTPRGVGFARTSTNLSDWRKANAGLPTITVDGLARSGHNLFALAARNIYQWDPVTQEWFAIGFFGNVTNLDEENGIVLASTDNRAWQLLPGGTAFLQIEGSPYAFPTPGADMDAGVGVDGLHVMAGSDSVHVELAGGGWESHGPPGPPGNTYSNIVIDGPRVYAATRNEGIGRWNEDEKRWFGWPHVPCDGCPNTFKFPDEVFAMLVGKDGRKWVSCWRYALERFDDSVEPNVFEHLWDSSSRDTTRHTLAFGAALDDTGGVWFGMDTDNLGGLPAEFYTPLGLDHYDSKGNHVGAWGPSTPPGSLVRGGKIRAVTVDKEGRVWVGYAGAANSGVDNFSGRPEAGPDADFDTVEGTTSMDVWSIVAYGDSIWVLTDRELRRIRRFPATLLSTSYETPAGRPLGMRLMDVAPNGEVYVGSEEGVRRYMRGDAFEDFTTANSPLASNDVRAIAIDRTTGVVWIGTAAGLNRFDPGYRPPTPPPGVPDTIQVVPSLATVTGAGVQLRLFGTIAGYTGGIYDVRGRLVRAFTTTTRGQVFWDGRDRDGAIVRPGVYFLRADWEGRRARARFVLLH